ASSDLNSSAEDLFRETYLNPPVTIPTSTTNASGTSSSATSSNIFSSSSINHEDNSSSTAAGTIKTSPIIPLSIRDLVKDSLTKVRGAYQIFIEMSNLVRKLLG